MCQVAKCHFSRVRPVSRLTWIRSWGTAGCGPVWVQNRPQPVSMLLARHLAEPPAMSDVSDLTVIVNVAF